MFALGLPMALFASFGDPNLRFSEWFGPPQDGAWIAETLDGKRAQARYTLGIRWGKVAGGRDGCNSWGFTRDDKGPGTDRILTTDLQECIPLAGDAAYRSVAMSDPTLTMLGEDRMRLEASGHVAVFRRMRDAERTNR